MQLFNVLKKEQGFTLVEMIVTVVVVGVLMAVAVPSLVGLFNQTRVKDGLRQIETSLKEAQKLAMRRGSTCTVTLDNSNNTITANPVSCLAGSKTVDDRLEFKGDVDDPANNANLIVVTFSHKGHNTTGARTIAIYPDGVTDGVQKCVILTPTLGGVKSGTYTGDVGGDIVQNSCDVSSN
ncbi:MAG: prepilin-type N-terminal cleavage/methylation domain-containing protein [Pleurocapsa sp. MO_192.B19]|nr:prepilin-type N-terminal cleavage/methylation domain-containing protein [Pleurocapsa sp. MO_192.B19]